VSADITTLASIGAVLSSVKSAFGNKIDILILNASFNTRPKLGQASEADIDNSLVGNLHWPIMLIENIVRQKIFNDNSRMVIMSSDRVRDPAPGSSLFNATKSGMEALTRSWAIELPLTFPGMTVNAVSVGLTDTPGLRGFPAQAVEALKAQRVPKVKVVEGGRMGYAEDVADVVGWLVSEKARWQTGSVVAANGGAEWVGGSS
jgi:3-oxoacyl-[acyl-carrier protein] reductase